jgi:hypothetical protein
MNRIECIWWADTDQKSPCHSLELQSMFVGALPYNQRRLVKLFHLTNVENKLLVIIFLIGRPNKWTDSAVDEWNCSQRRPKVKDSSCKMANRDTEIGVNGAQRFCSISW